MRYASFFSGIGGFELALDAAGFQRVFSCEIEPFCNEIFKARWGHECEAKDITTLKPEEIPDADLWVGGFPCQDLSVAGKRGGLKANRSGLVWKFLELAAVRRPHALWLENVPGLLSSENGRDFALLLREMEELGYSCEWRVLDAQYQGVPQRRRRVFIVGHLGADCFPEILLEPKGRRGNPPKGRQEGKIASGEIARSLGGVGGRQDYGANKGTLAASVSAHNKAEQSYRGDGTDDLVVDKAHPVSFGTKPGFSDRGDGGENLVVGDKAPAVDGNMNRTGNERTEAEKLVIAHAVSKSSGGGLGGRDGQDDYVVGALTSHKKKHGSEATSGQAAEAGHVVAAPLTHGSHPNSNAPSRRREDDENIVFVDAYASRGSCSPNQGPVKLDGKSDALDTTGPGAVAFAERTRDGEKKLEVMPGGVTPALTNPGEGGRSDSIRVAVPVAFDAHNNPKDQTGTLCGGEKGGGKNEINLPLIAIQDATTPKTGDKAFSLTQPSPSGGGHPQAIAVPISSDALREGEAKTPSKDAEGKVRLRDPGLGVGKEGDPSFAVNASTPPAIAFQSTGGSRDVQAGEKSPPVKVGSGCDIPSPPAVAIDLQNVRPTGDQMGTIRSAQSKQNVGQAVAFDTYNQKASSGSTPAVRPPGGGDNVSAVAFEHRIARNDRGAPSPVVPPLKAESGQTGKGDGAPSVMAPSLRGYGHGAQGQHNDDASRMMLIRRLTPTECERLQGFPDGHTCLCGVRPDCPDRRIPPWVDPSTFKLGGCGHSACGCTCSDSARYRSLGNAVAVPVIRWIAERVKQCLTS